MPCCSRTDTRAARREGLRYGPQPYDVNDQPDALHDQVLLSEPHAVEPHCAVMGVLPGPVPLQLQAPPSSVQPADAYDQPEALHDHVFKSSPHAC